MLGRSVEFTLGSERLPYGNQDSPCFHRHLFPRLCRSNRGRDRGSHLFCSCHAKLNSPPRDSLPNMRVKLAGALVLKEALESCPGGRGLSSATLAPAGESPAAYARSVRRPLIDTARPRNLKAGLWVPRAPTTL